MSGQPEAIDHVVLVTEDVPAAVAFYERVLNAEVQGLHAWEVGEAAYPVLHFGSFKINVHSVDTDAQPVAGHPVPGALDLAFRWPGTAEQAAAHLASAGVPVETGPVAREGALGPARSVYFRDADGNLIELLCYQ